MKAQRKITNTLYTTQAALGCIDKIKMVWKNNIGLVEKYILLLILS